MDSCIKDDFEKFLEMMSTLYLRKDVKKLCWGLLFNDLPGIVWCEGELCVLQQMQSKRQ